MAKRTDQPDQVSTPDAAPPVHNGEAKKKYVLYRIESDGSRVAMKRGQVSALMRVIKTLMFPIPLPNTRLGLGRMEGKGLSDAVEVFSVSSGTM